MGRNIGHQIIYIEEGLKKKKLNILDEYLNMIMNLGAFGCCCC
jgi:hypothetical protein